VKKRSKCKNEVITLEQQPKKSSKVFWIIVCVLFIVVITLLTIKLFPYMMLLTKQENQLIFKEWIDSLGKKGLLVVLLIQLLQVIFAFIPGEPVEVVAGMLYGTLGGLIVCEIGILLGTLLIYYTVKKLGRRVVKLFVSEEDFQKYHFLHNTKQLEMVTFLLFFIPGTPKDALTYLIPLTPMRPERFFAIALFARIPSVISSTFAGANFSEGNYWIMALTFLLIGAVGLVGVYYHKNLLEKWNAHKERNTVKRAD